MPEVWVRSWRKVTGTLGNAGLATAKSRCGATGSSSLNAPSCHNSINAVAVTVLLTEAIWKIVSGVT
jgi:hypothetical protein